MKSYTYKQLTTEELTGLLKRPAIDMEKSIEAVRQIVSGVKVNGVEAAIAFARQFDGFTEPDIRVSEEEMKAAEEKLDTRVKEAIDTAAANITTFHRKQERMSYTIETMPGVECSREFRPIENVGLYIPGGTAPLPSTMLMLGIPAKLAGCKRVVAVSPQGKEPLHPAILYAARVCGIKEIYKTGGAHGIALMAYGDSKEGIEKVDKIFGPGNQFVTAAKTVVSLDPDGAAIDMPAGPSEVLVIADEEANPVFVAADLLSQAEHGADSQVALVATNKYIAERTVEQVKKQLAKLPRKEMAEKALEGSVVLLVDNLQEAFYFSNRYAPEHLILNIKNAEKHREKVTNAGSVFLGAWSPESVGDYASGTNHSLPTYGYARMYSGVSLDDFMKSITFQQLSREGLEAIAPVTIALAETEGLDAHANAVKVRIEE